jgi:hypothetical protein
MKSKTVAIFYLLFSVSLVLTAFILLLGALHSKCYNIRRLRHKVGILTLFLL